MSESRPAARPNPCAMPAPPRLLALATAVPPHRLHQDEVARWARRLFGDGPALARLLPAYANAGIETRYSCVPLDWYSRPHGWAEKTRLYVDNATRLLEEAARLALERAGVAACEIDSVVVASTTGIATPSLDALLIEPLGLRPDVHRLPIFGLGCAGGVVGLARAAALARAAPGSRVLFMVVELCGLTFRRADQSKANIIATALFGDGAAAALLGPGGPGPALGAAGEHTWPDSREVMGWQVEDDGLSVLFSRDIPRLVRTDLGPAASDFLARQGLAVPDLAGLICHPGGAKVIAAMEAAFGRAPGTLASAREVLRHYGNMSAATVLFVLEREWAALAPGPHLMVALGPGFSAGFQLIEAA